MRKILYLFIIGSFLLVTSCKKENTDGPSKNGSALDLMRDSLYLYVKQVYYWNDAIPDYKTFSPRSYSGTNDLNALKKELFALSQYKINPATGKAYEYYSADPTRPKYSFIDDGATSQKLDGITGDFGFAPIWNEINDLRVRYVAPGSPADIAGIKRGYIITSINGRTDLTYDGGSGSGTNLNFVINAYTNSTTIALGVTRYDGSTFTTTLNTASYTLNPVFVHKVIDQDGHKTGYIVFNSFTSPDNADAKLDEAFNEFAAAGITDLVVDLRYNGGGFVSTSERLANMIAPASKNGSLMYNLYYNSLMQTNKPSILVNQVRKDEETGEKYTYDDIDYSIAGNARKFNRAGLPAALTLNNVFFLVTGSTASASELLINNLIPVMNVKLIGTTTYGKPVGFSEIDINKYQMYTPMFESKNSAGQGGYFTGMVPASTTYPGYKDFDDVTKDFGDPTEGLLAHALKYVKAGTFELNGPAIQSTSRQPKTMSIDESREAAMALDVKQFNNMVIKTPLNKKK